MVDIDTMCTVGGKTIAHIENEFGGRLDAVREESKIVLAFTDGTKLPLYARDRYGTPMIMDN